MDWQHNKVTTNPTLDLVRGVYKLQTFCETSFKLYQYSKTYMIKEKQFIFI